MYLGEYSLSLCLSECFSHLGLIVKGGFETTKSIGHIVQNIIQMGLSFTSPESVKNIACVSQK